MLQRFDESIWINTSDHHQEDHKFNQDMLFISSGRLYNYHLYVVLSGLP